MPSLNETVMEIIYDGTDFDWTRLFDRENLNFFITALECLNHIRNNSNQFPKPHPNHHILIVFPLPVEYNQYKNDYLMGEI